MDLSPRRAFRGPSGRAWSAQVFHFPASSPSSAPGAALRTRARTSAVLRFTSGEVVLDLEEWPEDWMQLTDEELVALVRQANPPRI